MRIEFNGAMIYFNDDEFDDVSKLKCICGHSVWSHGSPIHWSKPNESWVPVSQCVLCDCKQFRIKDE